MASIALLIACAAWSNTPTVGFWLAYPDHADVYPEDHVWLWTDGGSHALALTEDGVEVAFETHAFGAYTLLSIDGGWVPDAEYLLTVDGWSEFAFGAASGATPVATPPVAVRRTVWADETVEAGTTYSGGTSEPFVWSGATLGLCSLDLRAVGAIGDSEPPIPAIDDGVPWTVTESVVRFTSEDGWPDAGPGATTTFWVGSIDAVGRFSGWVAEPIALPGSEEKRSDRREGVGATTTPTSWDVCPTGDWILGEVEQLGGDGDVDGDGDDGGCGCASGGSPAAWIWLPLVWVRRSRRAAS